MKVSTKFGLIVLFLVFAGPVLKAMGFDAAMRSYDFAMVMAFVALCARWVCQELEKNGHI